MASIVASGGAPTLKEQARRKEQERRSGVEADPLVAQRAGALSRAREIVAVRGKEIERSRRRRRNGL